MRVAAIYDIHGNLPALEAVLQEIRQLAVDQVVIGGDVLPYRHSVGRSRSGGPEIAARTCIANPRAKAHDVTAPQPFSRLLHSL